MNKWNITANYFVLLNTCITNIAILLMSPYGTEHFKNAIRAHKHFLINMGISGHIYACACIQWLKLVMPFHYAKYDRNPINDWFPAKRQTFKWVYLKTMKTADEPLWLLTGDCFEARVGQFVVIKSEHSQQIMWSVKWCILSIVILINFYNWYVIFHFLSTSLMILPWLSAQIHNKSN